MVWKCEVCRAQNVKNEEQCWQCGALKPLSGSPAGYGAITTALAMMESHDMLEEADKLKQIAATCGCSECKGYRAP